MAADVPTILATSGGLRPAQRNPFVFGPLLTYAIDLAGVSGRAPRVCLVNTAAGDQAWSAGSICWHVGGTTDSFGPDLQRVTNGLAFLPYANGVHYDSEAQR